MPETSEVEEVHCVGCTCARICKCGRYEVKEEEDFPGSWYPVNESADFDHYERHSPSSCTRTVDVEIDPLKDHGYSRL